MGEARKPRRASKKKVDAGPAAAFAAAAETAANPATAAADDLALCLVEAAVGMPGAPARVAAQLRPALRARLRDRLERAEPTTLADAGALVQQHWQQLAPGGAAGELGAAAGLGSAARADGGDAARALYPLYLEHAASVMQGLTAELAARCTPAAECAPALQALAALAELDARLARLVRLRWFAGLDLAQVAGVLGENELEIQRAWHKARAFVAAAMLQSQSKAAPARRRRSRAKRASAA